MNYRNAFLAAIDPADIAVLSPHLVEVHLERGQTLYDVGGAVQSVFFPSSAVISVATVMSDGRSVETGTVGYESGVALLDAATRDTARSQVSTQVAGAAIRLPSSVLRHQLQASWRLTQLVLQHCRANVLQAEQSAACNVLHDIECRLSRWLLMTSDRVGSPDFPLTQDYMAVMTGSQRTTISATAAALKAAGLIAYTRGKVRITDRPGLRRRACECYGEVREQFDGLRSIVRDDAAAAAMSSAG